MDSDKLLECSKFSHLVLFKKPPCDIGSVLLHLPTSSYKYDLYFHLCDEDKVRVSLWRYFSNSWHSEMQDSVTVTVDDYIENMHVVDEALSKVQVNVLTNCAWIDQRDAQSIYKHYKSLASSAKTKKQMDMFA
ncbi:hypothetical protein ACT3RN_00845 [Psychrobacter sp. AOP5-GZ1-6]|uniref:hypothetical protein n=1 Tax=unclassified Psychrobacter TaxID=196806 RepID=UPI0017882BC9|nr:hypothetical protein [Psychrobacter sp. FME13]MBE0440564.1 hypothetical protein [Psychrobacter sp. FME13]